MKESYPDDEPGTLDIVVGLARQPVSFRETDPQPRKHTLCQATSDFTDGQASIHRPYCYSCNAFLPQANVLGRPPHLHELLKKTHTKANNEFVDLKSKRTYDAVMSKIASASRLVDESNESPTIDFSKIYMDEVGRIKKVCIYGLGSQAIFYGTSVSSSSSTAQPQDCDFDARVKAYVQEMKDEMKCEMREGMREEIRHELREEIKNEIQLDME